MWGLELNWNSLVLQSVSCEGLSRLSLYYVKHVNHVSSLFWLCKTISLGYVKYVKKWSSKIFSLCYVSSFVQFQLLVCVISRFSKAVVELQEVWISIAYFEYVHSIIHYPQAFMGPISMFVRHVLQLFGFSRFGLRQQMRKWMSYLAWLNLSISVAPESRIMGMRGLWHSHDPWEP